MSEPTALEEIERLFDRMNRQIEQASESFRRGEPVSAFYGGTMPVDIVEREGEFHVTVDVPGFSKKDVDVQVTDHTLRIEAERSISEDVEEENYVRRERSRRSMSRTIALPDEIDGDSVKAEMEDGVLSITVPKTESAKARKIKIS
ncbi:MAG: Hsp20/alpha crystallin family protein [Halobacteriales archaeon]|nr:Hsp20/alpha crystallin family protein [Halobacteriales archaeon]